MLGDLFDPNSFRASLENPGKVGYWLKTYADFVWQLTQEHGVGMLEHVTGFRPDPKEAETDCISRERIMAVLGVNDFQFNCICLIDVHGRLETTMFSAVMACMGDLNAFRFGSMLIVAAEISDIRKATEDLLKQAKPGKTVNIPKEVELRLALTIMAAKNFFDYEENDRQKAGLTKGTPTNPSVN